jgi:phage terminase large subunit
MTQTAIKIDIYDDIYNSVYVPYLDLRVRTQIFFGGSSSGKSFFLAQRCVEDLLQGGRNYLIVRNVSNTLRTSTFNELKKAISDYGVSHLFKINKSEMIVTCLINDYQAIFKGLDDEEKIKSVTPEKGVVTDIWVEEATECKYEAVKQLSKRLRGKSKVPKRLVLSFNPIYKTHWIFKEYFLPVGWADGQKQHQDSHLSILKTTYADNEWLEEDDIFELENESNEYYRDVYTYGNWGILGDVVFTNWRVENIDHLIPGFDNIRNGLDFGFTNDPTAYIRSHYNKKRKKIYIFDNFDERGLTNPDIAKRLSPIVGREAVWCDSAEPKSIKELQDNEINAKGVKKGKDSILHGIQFLQQHEIIVSHKCQPVVNELTLYQWKKDKEGESINEPVDKDNHYMDATRYAYENEQGRVFGWAA